MKVETREVQSKRRAETMTSYTNFHKAVQEPIVELFAMFQMFI